jgi:hypothetical protein
VLELALGLLDVFLQLALGLPGHFIFQLVLIAHDLPVEFVHLLLLPVTAGKVDFREPVYYLSFDFSQNCKFESPLLILELDSISLFATLLLTFLV